MIDFEALENSFINEFGECPNTSKLADDYGEDYVAYAYKTMIDKAAKGWTCPSPLGYFKGIIERMVERGERPPTTNKKKKTPPPPPHKTVSWVTFKERVEGLDRLDYSILGVQHSVGHADINRLIGQAEVNALDAETRWHLLNIQAIVLGFDSPRREYRIAKDAFPDNRDLQTVAHRHCFGEEHYQHSLRLLERLQAGEKLFPEFVASVG